MAAKAYRKEIGLFVGLTTGCSRAADGSVVGFDAANPATLTRPYQPVGSTSAPVADGYVPVP